MDFRPTTECPHCGAVLKARTTQLAGRTLFCGYEQCGCPGAEAEREKERRAKSEAARMAMHDKAVRDWKRAGVPERYVSLDHPLAAEIADGMKSGQWVYLWGDVGTRKTTCAAAVAKRLAGGKRSVLMAPMYRILDEIQRSFHEGGDPLKRYAEVRYLIVDDLGKRRPTGFVLDSLFSLVDQRYSAMLPTLVTTQYKPSDLVRSSPSRETPTPPRPSCRGSGAARGSCTSTARTGGCNDPRCGHFARLPQGTRRALRQAAPGGALHPRQGLRGAIAPMLRLRQACGKRPPRGAPLLGRDFPPGDAVRHLGLAKLAVLPLRQRHHRMPRQVPRRGAAQGRVRWRHPVYEEAWWTGQLLQVYEPHSPGLYEYGYWLITDRDANEMIREGM
jgi:hypothetical protein